MRLSVSERNTQLEVLSLLKEKLLTYILRVSSWNAFKSDRHFLDCMCPQGILYTSGILLLVQNLAPQQPRIEHIDSSYENH